MTKKVRVENADLSDHKMIVQVWDKGLDGAPDVMSHEVALNSPTDLTEQYLTSTRYLVIKET